MPLLNMLMYIFVGVYLRFINVTVDSAADLSLRPSLLHFLSYFDTFPQEQGENMDALKIKRQL